MITLLLKRLTTAPVRWQFIAYQVLHSAILAIATETSAVLVNPTTYEVKFQACTNDFCQLTLTVGNKETSITAFFIIASREQGGGFDGWLEITLVDDRIKSKFILVDAESAGLVSLILVGSDGPKGDPIQFQCFVRTSDGIMGEPRPLLVPI
jgi:hypothetical protein